MRVILTAFISAALLALPTAAPAQNQNIRYRSIALEACEVEGWGGYPNYETCTEETYQHMVHYGAYPIFVGFGNGQGGEGTWLGPLGCFAMNHNNMCHVSDEGPDEPN